MPRIKTSLVGIINVTPDSFSDGGSSVHFEEASALARKMVKEGASVIDIGAESTRPGAKTISPDEEWKRLGPALEAIRKTDLNAWISVDTRNFETAQKAILLGIDWINDVSGLENQKMIELVANNAVNVVVMHNLGIPADKNLTISENENPVQIVTEWAKNKILQLEKYGIKKERIIFDPGIGFGKTAQQSLDIVMNIASLRQLGVRLLVGHSRKSFLNIFTEKKPEQRDYETSIFSSYLANAGVDYLRVHNISVNKNAIENNFAKKLSELESNQNRV
mgnify:CR=1 FL=1